jgi:hypothetical protein
MEEQGILKQPGISYHQRSPPAQNPERTQGSLKQKEYIQVIIAGQAWQHI